MGVFLMPASVRNVIGFVQSWRPRNCESEKEFERSLKKHLEKNLPKSDVISQFAQGRMKGDIVVDDRILIELKADLNSTAKMQRLLGQIDDYESKWKGEVIVVICGDVDRDLLKTLRKKIESYAPSFFSTLLDDQKLFLCEK
jgi:hypothetical protein